MKTRYFINIISKEDPIWSWDGKSLMLYDKSEGRWVKSYYVSLRELRGRRRHIIEISKSETALIL